MGELRPNGQRAKNAITLIWIILILEIASLISGYFQYNLLQAAANGAEISIEEANSNDSREQVIGILYLIAFIISSVTFIQWFRRAYFNLHQKVDYLSYTEGWAAGSWFVPILHLYRPYQIMREIYRKTEDLLISNRVDFGINLSMSSLAWWWAFWIINNFIGQFVYRYSLKAESIDELITLTVAGMLSNLVGIPLAILAVKVIKNYANVEPMLSELKREDELIEI